MTSPLDQYAPWPNHIDDATADALIRHAAVHAHAALALAAEGHDVPRQLERALRYFVTAALLGDLAADPDRADASARRIWDRLGDGGDVPDSIAGWLTVFGLDPDEIDATAVAAYRARAEQVAAETAWDAEGQVGAR